MNKEYLNALNAIAIKALKKDFLLASYRKEYLMK